MDFDLSVLNFSFDDLKESENASVLIKCLKDINFKPANNFLRSILEIKNSYNKLRTEMVENPQKRGILLAKFYSFQLGRCMGLLYGTAKRYDVASAKYFSEKVLQFDGELSPKLIAKMKSLSKAIAHQVVEFNKSSVTSTSGGDQAFNFVIAGKRINTRALTSFKNDASDITKQYINDIVAVQSVRLIHFIESSASDGSNSEKFLQNVMNLKNLYMILMPETKDNETNHHLALDFDSQEVDVNDYQEKFENFVDVEVKINHTDLKTLMSKISSIFVVTLTKIDENFIENIFIATAMRLWKEECFSYLENLNANIDVKVIAGMLKLFKGISTFEEFPENLKNSKFYKLIHENANLITKQQEIEMIREIKMFNNEIILSNKLFEFEIGFRNAMIKTLRFAAGDFKNLIENFQLEEFVKTQISTQNLFLNIIKSSLKVEGMAVLKLIAGDLEKPENFFLEEELREIIEIYLQPTIIKEKTVNDRKILKISGKILLASEFIDQLKNIELFKEIHFMCDVFHIDKSVSWHGKTIGISANIIKIHGDQTWNVSGYDGVNVFGIKDLGFDKINGRGLDGMDGSAGESGGNLTVLCNEIFNAVNWTLKSNGGNGATGQNAGHGRHGVDGINCTKIVLTSVSIDSDLKNCIHKDADLIVRKEFPGKNSGYVHYQVEDKEFYLIHNKDLIKENLLLAKGSSGTPSSEGGIGGFGGEAGSRGSIYSSSGDENMKFVKVENLNGTKAKNGLSGNHGIHGLDGTDVGLIAIDKEYFSDESKLKIELTENQNNPKIWSEYHQTFAGFNKDSVVTRGDRSFNNELMFLYAILEVLRNSYNEIDHVKSRLKLQDFLKSSMTFSSFIENIANLNEVWNGKLKKIAEILQTHQKILIADEIKQEIESFMKTFNLLFQNEGSKLTAQVVGKIVIMSEVKEKLKNSSFNELQIECDTLHVNTNLSQEVWHGKNVAIVANFIIVHDQQVWNFSGYNGENHFDEKLPVNLDGSGINGIDGTAGECGGNISISCNQILNAASLKIISNGGDGSSGQNGGNSRKGDNGIGCTISDMTVNGNEMSGQLKFEELIHTGGKIITKYHESFVHYEFNSKEFLIIKNSGELLVLCMGSSGKAAKIGGFGGYYGEAGLSGKIVIKSNDSNDAQITVEAFNGSVKAMGTGGLQGDHGDDGNDVGLLLKNGMKTFLGVHSPAKLALRFEDLNGISSDYHGKFVSIVEVAKKSRGDRSFTDEFAFRTTLVEFLYTNYKQINSLKQPAALDLRRFASQKISFNGLIAAALRLNETPQLNNVKELKAIAGEMKDLKNLKLEQELRKEIGKIIAPEVHEKNNEGEKLFYRFFGQIVSISNLSEYFKLRMDETEMLIVCDIFYVDYDVKPLFYANLSLGIIANRFEVVKNNTWNFSGDSLKKTVTDVHIYDADDGFDGFAGESGGVVLIEAKTIRNASNLTVYLNGANGGAGGPGKNGKDGTDGKTATNFYYEGKEVRAYTAFTKIPFGQGFYETVEDGHYKNMHWHREVHHDVVFLIKGQKGTNGSKGFDNGLGGEGGFKGKLDVICKNQPEAIKVFAEKGSVGSNGNGGLYGYNGIDGGDAYLYDYNTKTSPSKEGLNGNELWTIEHSKKKVGSHSVRCHEKNKPKYAYPQRMGNVDRTLRRYKTESSTRSERNRQHQSKAKAQSEVPIEKLRELYREKVLDMTNDLKDKFREFEVQSEKQAEKTKERNVNQPSRSREVQAVAKKPVQTGINEMTEANHQKLLEKNEIDIKYFELEKQNYEEAKNLKDKDNELNATELTRNRQEQALMTKKPNIPVDELQNVLGINETNLADEMEKKLEELQQEQINIKEQVTEVNVNVKQTVPVLKQDDKENTGEGRESYLKKVDITFDKVMKKITDVNNFYEIFDNVKCLQMSANECQNLHNALKMKQELFRSNFEPKVNINLDFKELIQKLRIFKFEDSPLKAILKPYQEFEEKIALIMQEISDYLLQNINNVDEKLNEKLCNALIDKTKASEFVNEISSEYFLKLLFNVASTDWDEAFDFVMSAGAHLKIFFAESVSDKTFHKKFSSDQKAKSLLNKITKTFKSQSNEAGQFAILFSSESFKKAFKAFLKENCNCDEFSYWHRFVADETFENVLDELSKVILEKYKNATLQNIYEGQPDDEENLKLPEKLSADQSEPYLQLVNPTFSSSFSTIKLGTLEDYFVKDSMKFRKEITQFFKQCVLNVKENANFLHKLAKIISDDVETIIRQHCEDFLDSYEEKTSEEDRFELLLNLYNNTTVYNNIIQLLTDEGIQSLCYRFVLAFAFKINFREFELTMENSFDLIGDYFNEFDDNIHFFNYNGNFFTLSIDEGKLRNDEKLQSYGQNLHEILLTVTNLKSFEEVENYQRTRKFLAKTEKVPEKLKFSIDETILIENILRNFDDENNKKSLVRSKLEGILENGEMSREVLRSIASKFFVDGLQLPIEEFDEILFYILAETGFNSSKTQFYNFIINACPQYQWLVEIAIVKLCRVFSKTSNQIKSECRKHLSLLENRMILILLTFKIDELKVDEISEESFLEMVKLIKSFSKSSINLLEELNLMSWKYAIAVEHWAMALKALEQIDESKNEVSVFYMMEIQIIYGTQKVTRLVEIFQTKKSELKSVDLSIILRNFFIGEWSLSDEMFDFLEKTSADKWIQTINDEMKINGNQRSLDQIVKYIANNAETTQHVRDNLHVTKANIEEMFKMTAMDKLVSTFEEDDVILWHKEHFDKNSTPILETIAVVARAFQLKTAEPGMPKGKTLRYTQLFSIFEFIQSEKGILQQVSTGEGKTFIGVAFACVKILYGAKVDIVTSSPVLATRDAIDKLNIAIFGLFGINVGDNCSESLSERQAVYSNCAVVYGALGNFQRDYLLHTFYDKNVFGDRKFDIILIDEVDSMLLDKGNNILYMSNSLPDMEKIEPIFVFIWSFINQTVTNEEDFSNVMNPKTVRENLINDMFGLLRKIDIQALFDDEFDDDIDNIWENLKKSLLVDGEGVVLKLNATIQEVSDAVPTSCPSHITDSLCYFFEENRKKSRQIPRLPNYLHKFVMLHVDNWIESAIRAYSMSNERDYIIDRNRAGGGSFHPNVIILDLDTGTDLVNSEWDEALHQFIQLKHGCKISLMSLKSVFISNVSFFKLYVKNYGMSGTLGAHLEREELSKLYDVDFITIPTFRPKNINEQPTIVERSYEDWMKAIGEEVIQKSKDQGILIICETIEATNEVEKHLKNLNVSNLVKYQRDYEEFNIGDFQPGRVIVSTNLAGRGTDIKLSQTLKMGKGLHVILSYLPPNIRIEQQAFGRAARGGDPGSGILIILSHTNKNSIELKQQRNLSELQRIESVVVYYTNFIQIEEQLFIEFQNVYKEFNDNNPEKKIMKGNFLMNWTFWLDSEEKNLDDLKAKNFSEITKSLQGFLEKQTRVLPSTSTKLAKHFASEGDYHKSLSCINETVDRDGESAVLMYLKFFVELKIQSNNRCTKFPESFKSLTKAFNNFDRYLDDLEIRQLQIGPIQEKSRNSFVQLKGMEMQKKSSTDITEVYLGSIYSLLGYPINPAQIISPVSIDTVVNKEFFDALYDRGAVRGPSINKAMINEASTQMSLENIAENYFLKPKDLKRFLFENAEKKFKDVQKIADKVSSFFSISSRENFWNFLLQKQVLRNEKFFVTINIRALAEFDPSMLDIIKYNVETNQITSKVLKVEDKDELFLYNITDDNESLKEGLVFVLEKDSLEKIVTQKTIEIYNKMEIIRFNRKAKFTKSEISFSTFDSLNIQDFKFLSENFPIKTAENLCKLLTDKEVLVEDKFTNVFKMTEKGFENFTLVDFSKYFMFKYGLIFLLNNLFAYRIAYEKLVSDFEDQKENISIALTSNPHINLVSDLITVNLIDVPKLEFIDNSERKKRVRIIVQNSYSHQEFINLLKTRLPDEKVTDQLVEALKAKKIIWQYPLQNKSIRIEDFNIDQEFFTNSENGKIEKTIKLLLKSHLNLSNNVDNIIKKLDEYTSLFKKGFDCADMFLKSFAEDNRKLSNEEEFGVFLMNGLDFVIHVEEKKNFWGMFWRFLAVVLIGILQIVAGAIIKVLSVGTLANVGMTLIGEGIGDIVFAITSFVSGQFTWEDYGKHKLISLAISIATFGVGAAVGAFKTTTSLGMKIGGVPLANHAGRALIKEVGMKVIVKKVFKTMIQKVLLSVAIAGVDIGINHLMENQLDGLMESMTEKMIGNVKEKIDNHSIAKVFEDYYMKFGEVSGEKIDNHLEKIVEEKRNLKKNISLAFDLLENVLKFLESSKKNIFTTGIALVAEVSLFQKTAAFAQLMVYVDTLLTSLKAKLFDDINVNNFENKGKAEDFGAFKETLYDSLKATITAEARDIISSDIVGPTLKQFSNYFVAKAAKTTQKVVTEIYNSHKETKYRKQFEALKNNQNSFEQESKEKAFIKLMTKSTNAKLRADLIRENTPFDTIAVEAVAAGVLGGVYKIVVHHENGLTYTFGNLNGKIIELSLKNNHFTNSNVADPNNNCFYHALADKLPLLKQKLSPDEFRNRVAREIETNRNIQKVISKQWFKFHMKKGAYGGNPMTIEQVFKESGKNYKQFDNLDDPKSSTYKTFVDNKRNFDLRRRDEKGNIVLSTDTFEFNKLRKQAAEAALAHINKAINDDIESRRKPNQPKTIKTVKLSDFDVVEWVDTIAHHLRERVKVKFPVHLKIKPNVCEELGTNIGKIEFNLDDPFSQPGAKGPNTGHIGFEYLTGKGERVLGHYIFGNKNDSDFDNKPPSRTGKTEPKITHLTAYDLSYNVGILLADLHHLSFTNTVIVYPRLSLPFANVLRCDNLVQGRKELMKIQVEETQDGLKKVNLTTRRV